MIPQSRRGLHKFSFARTPLRFSKSLFRKGPCKQKWEATATQVCIYPPPFCQSTADFVEKSFQKGALQTKIGRDRDPTYILNPPCPPRILARGWKVVTRWTE